MIEGKALAESFPSLLAVRAGSVDVDEEIDRCCSVATDLVALVEVDVGTDGDDANPSFGVAVLANEEPEGGCHLIAGALLVVSVRDGVAGLAPEDHEAALRIMKTVMGAAIV